MKIVWTFDPFEKNKKLKSLGKKILSTLFDRSDKIEVTYVASHSEINLTTAFDIPKADRYFSYPKKLIQKQLKALKISKPNIKILSEIDASLTSATKKLALYASNSKVDLIVTSTRGKTGISRFVLGSFAESLIHYSNTDLLLYNAKIKFRGKPKTIVCAHDFSRKSVDTIQRLTEYAQKWKCSIVVLHVPKPEYFLKFPDQSSDVVAYREYVNDVATHLERSIEKYNVPCTTIIERNWKKREVESILSTASKVKADLIAVTAKSGRMAALMGGSVTRNIIRESNIPILVLKV